MFYKKQDYNKATYHSTKQCKQRDNVLMNRALLQRCRSHGTDRHEQRSQKPVPDRIRIPINHKTQQILRPAKKRTKNTTEAMTTKSTATSTRYTHQAQHEQALNTTNSNTTTHHTTAEDLNDEFENVLTGCATAAQEEKPNDNTITNNVHDEPLRRVIQKCNTTPNGDRQTKETQKDAHGQNAKKR